MCHDQTYASLIMAIRILTARWMTIFVNPEQDHGIRLNLGQGSSSISLGGLKHHLLGSGNYREPGWSFPRSSRKELRPRAPTFPAA